LPPGVRSPLGVRPKDRAESSALAGDKASAEEPQHIISGRHARFSQDAHDYLREHIRNADQKATFFFAALTALLAFLNTQNVPTRWIKDVRLWTFVDGLGFVSMLGLAIGAAILLYVVFPRLKGSRRGLLFFSAIAEYENSAEYADDVLTRSGDEIVRAKLAHCHELSKVCNAKYRALRAGFWAGAAGVATALLYMLLARNGPT
jgi:hypothetical protein